MAEPGDAGATIRVTMHQPGLARYRLPVFRELASRPGIRLKLLYSSDKSVPNVEPAGLDAQFVPQRKLLGGRLEVYWQKEHLEWGDQARSDVVVLPWNVRFASLLPAIMRARARGVGTLLWGHGYSKNRASSGGVLRRRIAGMATALMFYNHTAARRFVASGFDPCRVFVALNTIDLQAVRAARDDALADPARLPAFRKAEQIADRPIVLFVSRLDPANRVGVLLEAAAILRARVPDLCVVIVGGGADLERLKGIAARLDLGDAVRFLGPVYEEARLADWFLSASAYCYPANIGLSILHAFGYGVPVVTGDDMASHNPEIEALAPEENGLLFKHLDPRSLADVLERLINDRALRARLSAGALATAHSRFTLRNMVDGMESAIRYCYMRRWA